MQDYLYLPSLFFINFIHNYLIFANDDQNLSPLILFANCKSLDMIVTLLA